MSQTEILERRGNGKANDDTKTASIEQLGAILQTLSAGGMEIIHKLIDLAKTNPIWGAALVLATVDLAGHKVDWVKWQHQEQICTDCGVFSSVYDFFFGQHKNHNYEMRWVPGILSGACVTQISVMVLSAYGISAAGAIISDIANAIPKIGSSTQPAESLIKPSVTTLVEGGSNLKAVAVK